MFQKLIAALLSFFLCAGCIVFHECGSIPTEKEMKEASAPWLMFMVWHTDNLTNGKINTPISLKAIYNSDYFITLDELPDF